MSKSLARIVEGFALQVVAPAIGSLIGGPVGIFVTKALTAAGGSMVLSGALQTIAGLFAGSPKPELTETAIRASVPPRVSGYGTNRYYMAYALYTTARDGTAVDVGVFHDGKASAIRAHYIGDKRVTLTGSGYVIGLADGQFGENDDNVRVGTRLGNAVETAFSEVIAKVPDQWTANHRGDGCVTGFMLSKAVKTKNYQKIYPSGGPNQTPLSLVLDAQPVFDWRDPTQDVGDPRTWKFSENVCLHHAHYELVRKLPPPTLPPDDPDYWDEIADIYTARWNRLFAPTLSYWTAAADDCDVPVPLKGVQTILLEPADSGSGHITVAAVGGLATGMTIAISATGDTSLTETRAVTAIAPGSGGFVLTLDDDLDNDHPGGSQVTWSSDPENPATEPRYRSCVAHKHTDDHKSVIASLLACYDGWVSPRADGALVVYSGRFYEPTVEIGPDEIISYSLQDGVDEENAINTIAVSYISANHDYNVVETDSWIDSADLSARGKELPTTLANQVPSHGQGRRLAKRALAKTMAPKRGTVSTNYHGRVTIGQRFIRLRITEAGTTFLDAPVEITKLVRNISTGGVTFEWIVADPNVDAWNPVTEEGNPAPVGNSSPAQPLETPVISSALPEFDADGVRIALTVDAPDRADLTWYAHWRLTGAAVWGPDEVYTDTDPGPAVELRTGLVISDSSIEIEVAYQVGDGRLSAWSPTVTVDTTGDGTEFDGGDAGGVG